MTSPSPEQMRQPIEEVFEALEKVADERSDSLLLMTTTALRNVYGLYPDADALRLRGTPQHQARVDIHNAIAEVINGYLASRETCDPDG